MRERARGANSDYCGVSLSFISGRATLQCSCLGSVIATVRGLLPVSLRAAGPISARCWCPQRLDQSPDLIAWSPDSRDCHDCRDFRREVNSADSVSCNDTCSTIMHHKSLSLVETCNSGFVFRGGLLRRPFRQRRFLHGCESFIFRVDVQ